ncbi:MAG: FtsX-like permease family protein [Dokdonella sp.]
MEIRPILSALMRSKVSMILIGLQVALTLAIVTNSLFIIGQRLERMDRPSGMNEADTFTISSIGFGEGFDAALIQQADVDMIRQLPGIAAVTPTNTTPLSNGGWSTGVQLKPNQKTQTAGTAYYFVDQLGLDAFGLKLIAGRNFEAGEISNVSLNDKLKPTQMIVSNALALKLFPEGDALGKQIYMDDGPPTTIIGIVQKMQQPWVDAEEIEYSSLIPSRMSAGNATRYLVRAEPGRRDEVMKSVSDAMTASNNSRIVGSTQSMEKTREEAYSGDRAMAIILVTVITLLLAITALGIVGMASFWVAQRTKQIGTRRALGATRRDILRYFQTENFVITTLGLVVGGVLAYALSLWLMQNFQSPRLPWFYVPVGFVVLWLLGQIAVLGPALRASRVPPAVATRSV